MSHFTDEQFKTLGLSREQCKGFLSMYNVKLEDYKTFDDLHQRIHGNLPVEQQAKLDKQQEQALHLHRHSNNHHKWYRVIKALLRST